MTATDHRPAEPSAEARALLAEAAADYKAAQPKRKGLTHRDDAGIHARASRAAADQYANASVTH